MGRGWCAVLAHCPLWVHECPTLPVLLLKSQQIQHQHTTGSLLPALGSTQGACLTRIPLDTQNPWLTRATLNQCRPHPQGIPPLPQLKLKYYQLMIRYYSYYNNYLEMTRCYRAIYEVEEVQADAAQWPVVGGALLMRWAPRGSVCCGGAGALPHRVWLRSGLPADAKRGWDVVLRAA